MAREMVPRPADAAAREAYVRPMRQMNARINGTLVTATGASPKGP